MKRLVVLALTAVSSLLSGCATYDEYSYYDRDGYYEDEYYGDRHVGRRYYYDEWGNRVYIDDYDVSHRYGAYYGSASWGYPDYVRYNTYYSALWPTYRYYYDPYWSPGFYYGVTYFPRTYFGLNVGWYSWPYYQAYSPYRYSNVDHYYDWADYSRDRAADRQRYYGNHLPRYGSARNEAQALARATGARGAAQTYYGASAQPGGIVDPMQARQARARGTVLPFERGVRDEPYGPDGRGYGGFTGHGAQPNAREQIGRGRYEGARPTTPAYGNEAPVTRSPRGYDRDVERQDGYIAPAPNERVYSRGGERQPLRDSRIEQSQDTALPEPNRYEQRSRSPMPNREYDTGSRQILPRQTREPYNPVFERHVEEPAQVRSREVDRSRPLQTPPRYQPSQPMERSQPRTFERSEPRAMPTYERSEPRIERTQRYEPRPAPSFQRSEPAPQPRFEPRAAPSYSPQSPPSSSGSSDGGGRSSRGQLERIIRDDD